MRTARESARRGQGCLPGVLLARARASQPYSDGTISLREIVRQCTPLEGRYWWRRLRARRYGGGGVRRPPPPPPPPPPPTTSPLYSLARCPAPPRKRFHPRPPPSRPRARDRAPDNH